MLRLRLALRTTRRPMPRPALLQPRRVAATWLTEWLSSYSQCWPRWPC